MGKCTSKQPAPPDKFETKYIALRRIRERTNIMVVGSRGSGRGILSSKIKEILGTLIGIRIQIFDTYTTTDKEILPAVNDAYVNGIKDKDSTNLVLHAVIIAVDASKITVISRLIKLFDSIKELLGPGIPISIFFTRVDQRMIDYLCSVDSPIYERGRPPPIYYAEIVRPEQETPRKTLNYTIVSMIEDIVTRVHTPVPR